jgi:hypothetical protein
MNHLLVPASFFKSAHLVPSEVMTPEGAGAAKREDSWFENFERVYQSFPNLQRSVQITGQPTV